jgi:hypothetical protein
MNSSGEVAFGARVSGGSNDGVWYTSGGLLLQPALAIEGDSAPGGSFASLSTSSIRFNDSGHVAFRVSVGGDGYWSNRTGAMAAIVAEGDPAPGSSPASNFSNLNSTRFYLNNSSHIAFNDSNLDGVWSETTGAIQLVAGAGNPGPGGITINNVPRLEYNGNGYSAMVVDESATNNNYILSDRTGSLQKVVGAGDAAPGGGAFPLAGNPMGVIKFNNSDRLCFEATVEEMIGSTMTLRRGIFVEDAAGTLQLVGKVGSPLPDGTIPGSDTAIQLPAPLRHSSASTGRSRPTRSANWLSAPT